MRTPTLPALLLALAAGALASCATGPAPSLDAKTSAVLQAMNDRLAPAKTLRVHAIRKTSPGFHAGIPVAGYERGTVVVRRPNRLAARMNTSEGRRDIGYDGRELTIVDRVANTHAIALAPRTIDSTLVFIHDTYGMAPPVGELLANHPRASLLRGVRSGRHVGVQNVYGVPCDQMAFDQDGLSWQLWVGVADHLPRRITIAYPRANAAPLTMDAVITRWELDMPLPDVDLAVAPPAGSRSVEMVALQP